MDWPQFRGIAAAGIAEGFSLPTTWNAADGTNVLWKTPIPGLGLSSPVVWGDDIFISTSISGKKDAGLKVGLYGDIASGRRTTRRTSGGVYALDKKTGAVKWQQTAHKGVPKIKRHTKATHANSTLATDGERLIAFFGSEGLYAYDMKGKLLWKKDLGVLDAGFYMVPEAQWETGSSPVIHDGMVIVQADVQKGSFLAMFDAKDGREVWRVSAQRRADVEHADDPSVNGQTQILVNGMRHVGAYDFKTGKEIWKLSGGGDIPVPTPVVSDGLVYITNAHGAAVAGLCHPATRPAATSASSRRRPATRPSRGACRAAAATCARRSSTGAGLHRPLQRRPQRVRREDRREEVSGTSRRRDLGLHRRHRSPTTARSTSRARTARSSCSRPDRSTNVLAMNEMSTPVLATPAISEGRLLLRTQDQIMAIGKK